MISSPLGRTVRLITFSSVARWASAAAGAGRSSAPSAPMRPKRVAFPAARDFLADLIVLQCGGASRGEDAPTLLDAGPPCLVRVSLFAHAHHFVDQAAIAEQPEY